jgi:hypothetical protein
MPRRARLARMLSGRSDTMMLSATPHDGSARSFASLMALLDPTAISDPDDGVTGDQRRPEGWPQVARNRYAARVFPA